MGRKFPILQGFQPKEDGGGDRGLWVGGGQALLRADLQATGHMYFLAACWTDLCYECCVGAAGAGSCLSLGGTAFLIPALHNSHIPGMNIISVKGFGGVKDSGCWDSAQIALVHGQCVSHKCNRQ